MLVYCAAYLQGTTPWAEVAFDNSLGIYRLRDSSTGLWLVNSSGHFPYYRPEDTGSGETPEETPVIRTGKWVNAKDVVSESTLWHVASNYELLEFRDQWLDLYPNAKVTEYANYFWLTRQTPNDTWVLCDKYGYPYYLPKDKSAGITTPQNYYTDVTNQYIDDSTTNQYYNYETNEYITYDDDTYYSIFSDGPAMIGSPVDVNNGIINVGGQLLYIDNLTYDAKTQTYYVDAHDEYTYDSTTNNYVTNNYSYSIQYHVSHTSITYIGQSEEYDKRYELYYELPDGRSSADLTAEDLEQLSMVFADVVQYVRTADNIDQRALYHFDGNTEDSSYWSYCSSFEWASGASLTYMDEGTFEGSLYLDETLHDFTLTLPGNVAAGDWTLQFRYYQSHTEAPQMDSYLRIGAHDVLWFTGKQYLDKFGDPIATTSVGSWNEICIIRSKGVLYYYVNGVCLGSAADALYHGNTINFHFGSDQQTYKKIDELRFTSSVVYTPGSNYTPSSVPFDSNLALVLPDMGTLEDQGIGLIPSDNNLLSDVGLDDWTLSGVVDNLYSDIDAFKYGEGVDGYKFPDVNDGPYLIYNPTNATFSSGDLGTKVTFRGLGSGYGGYVDDADGVRHYFPANCLFLPVAYLAGSDLAYAAGGSSYGLKAGSTYTLSVVLADGSYSYLTFRINGDKTGYSAVTYLQYDYKSPLSFHLFSLGCGGSVLNDDSSAALGIRISALETTSYEIVYMELIEGTRPEFRFVEMYSSGSSELEEVILDEFISVTHPAYGNLMDDYGLADWSADGISDHFFSGADVSDVTAGTGNTIFPDFSTIVFNTQSVSVDQGSAGMVVDFGGHDPYRSGYSASLKDYYTVKNALFLPLLSYSAAGVESRLYGLKYDQVYTYSVVLEDGTSSSVTFTITEHCESPTVISENVGSALSFSAGYIGSMYAAADVGFYVYSEHESSVEIVYMELVEGSEPLFSLSREGTIYPADFLADAPILAVRTNRTISGYQIGGVRPSYPTTGLVYAMVEHGRIVSLQQYTGSAWEAVDGRIWTGERWIPCSSFDVLTLQDLYDVSGGSGDDYEYIYTESGFWTWLQNAWKQMLIRLDAIILALGGDPSALPGDSSDNEQNLTFWQRVKKIFSDALADVLESLLDLITRVLDLVLGLVYDLLDYFLNLITDAVTQGFGEFFAALMDESLLQFFRSEEPLLDEFGDPVLDEHGNPVMVNVLALPSGVAAVFAFVSAAIMVLPDELRFAFFFGIGVSFLLAVFKLIRS